MCILFCLPPRNTSTRSGQTISEGDQLGDSEMGRDQRIAGDERQRELVQRLRKE